MSDTEEAGLLGTTPSFMSIGSKGIHIFAHIVAEVRGRRHSRTSSCGGGFLSSQIPGCG